MYGELVIFFHKTVNKDWNLYNLFNLSEQSLENSVKNFRKFIFSNFHLENSRTWIFTLWNHNLQTQTSLLQSILVYTYIKNSTFLSHFHISHTNQFKSLANIPIIPADVEGNQRDNYRVLISWQILRFCVGFCQLFCWKYSIALLYNQKAIPLPNPWEAGKKKKKGVHLIYYFLYLSSIFVLGIQCSKFYLWVHINRTAVVS